MADIFTLETLRARHGDCLILHWGNEDDPQRILIDGGPHDVYEEFLLPRLEELRGEEEFLRFRMLLVSHVDQDHVLGLLDLTEELKRASERNDPIAYRFQTLWHNAFDDILGNRQKAQELVEEATRPVGGVAALDPESLPEELGLSPHGALVLASVGQGRELRLNAEALGIAVNQTASGEGGLLSAGIGEDLGDGLSLRLLGPSQERLDALQEEWDDYLRDREMGREIDEVELAAFVDDSVSNLASLVALAEKDGKTILLTGDARGDYVLEGLEAAELFADDGRFHVDVLKMPHHGSEHNVDHVFFQRIVAHHYVVSADGRHGNPDPGTYQMLLANRRPADGPFHLHFTYAFEEHIHDYPVDEMHRIVEAGRTLGLDFDVSAPENGSLEIPLL